MVLLPDSQFYKLLYDLYIDPDFVELLYKAYYNKILVFYYLFWFYMGIFF